MFYVAILVLTILLAPSAQAFSGRQLDELCRAPKGSTRDLSCSLYIRGFLDGMAMGSTANEFGESYCPPEQLPFQVARILIERELRRYPEERNMEAGSLAGRALANAFPCSKKSKVGHRIR